MDYKEMVWKCVPYTNTKYYCDYKLEGDLDFELEQMKIMSSWVCDFFEK
jgi:hypothetical protein